MLLVTVQIQDDEDKAMQNEEEAYIAKTQLNRHSPVVERAVIVSKQNVLFHVNKPTTMHAGRNLSWVVTRDSVDVNDLFSS